MGINVLASATSPAEDAGSLVAQQLLLGQQHFVAGQIDQAIAAYQSGLEAATAAGVDQIAADLVTELHSKLGNAYMTGGRFGCAVAQYKSALRLNPTLVVSWCSLGNAQLKSGNAKDAIGCYLEALKLNPAHWPSRINLAQALMTSKQYVMAKALLTELAEERPLDGQLRHLLGKTSFELNDMEAALRYFEDALALDPRNTESLYWIGGVRERMGDMDAARAAYAQAAQIQPLISRRGVKSPPDFRLLTLFAPFTGNTPAEYLLRDASFDTDTLALFDGSEPDASSLVGFQVVFNLISDADQAKAVLPAATRLVEKLCKPVINDPSKIQHTTRDAVAKLLPGIFGCRIPAILRLDAGVDVSVLALDGLLPFSFPVLARPAGTHGGDDFEKLESLPELSSFLGSRPDSDHYVIEYIDYASADGYFRKYRFIFVGVEILPYHLAIGNDWKVHHVSTDMANQPWMQREEATFLAEPRAVFTAENYQVLRTIQQRTGLDYFGIDCGFDKHGNIVVFEVNASMLVHDDNAEFLYKDASVCAIKLAFNAMLQQRAAAGLR